MLKRTKTREKVKEILENSNIPMSAADIYEKLKDDGITLSSIYRTLDTFTSEDIVVKDIDNNGTAMYSMHKENHCHYLECKTCHNKIKLDYCPYHNVNKRIKNKTKFEVDEQNVILYGTCENCQKKNK